MLDHFYDKLLHLHIVSSQNFYLERMNFARFREMGKWLFQMNAVLRFLDRFEDKYMPLIDESEFDLF